MSTLTDLGAVSVTMIFWFFVNVHIMYAGLGDVNPKCHTVLLLKLTSLPKGPTLKLWHFVWRWILSEQV